MVIKNNKLGDKESVEKDNMVLDWYKEVVLDHFSQGELVGKTKFPSRLSGGKKESDRLSLNRLSKRLMKDGKRAVADRIVVGCLQVLRGAGIQDPETYVVESLERVCPLVEVRSKRRGGRVVQVPFPLRANRSAFLGRKLLVKAASKRKERSMSERLAGEVLDIHQGRGEALKGRQQLHQQAIRNRSNLRLRW